MKIIWSPEALLDLQQALDYLAERNPAAADRLATGVLAIVEQLSSASIDGPEHVLANGERVRGWPHPPFRLYYQRREDRFTLLRIYHQRRAPIVR